MGDWNGKKLMAEGLHFRHWLMKTGIEETVDLTVLEEG